jgi:hypothetical protein
MDRNHTADEWDDSAELVYRELFSPEESRYFIRPERFQLPTRRIAYWSVGVSLLFAGVLVVSWMVERNRTTQRLGPTGRMNKTMSVTPVHYRKEESPVYSPPLKE